MQNLIEKKKNPLLVHFGLVKSLYFAVFLLECFFFKPFILNKIIPQNIWKTKNNLFKTIPGNFISSLTSATKVPQACVF